MNKIAAMDVLRKYGWLAQTPEDFREQVLSLSDLVRVKRGNSVYSAGDESGGIYGVVSGCVEMHMPGADGAATLTHIGQPSFWVGDIAAIGHRRRLLSITAAADTELLRLPRGSMMRITAADPAAWLNFAHLLSMNFAKSFGVVAMLRRADPIERVGALLLNLAGEAGPWQSRVPGSQSDLAAMACLSRSSISLALADLAHRALVRPGYGAIEIIDLAGLRAFLALSD